MEMGKCKELLIEGNIEIEDGLGFDQGRERLNMWACINDPLNPAIALIAIEVEIAVDYRLTTTLEIFQQATTVEIDLEVMGIRALCCIVVVDMLRVVVRKTLYK
ncbi:hypothetical protein L1887_29413 [Cichorium endivia]|nr:hypothetical protein L1887_29413 [Cichorium endivia]